MTPEPPETITGEVSLAVAGLVLKLRLTVPTAATPLSDLLPICHGLADTLVDRAVVNDAAPGRAVSCRVGCAACCRQPVPVAPSEARALALLVDEMPEPRRGIVRERFAQARATFAAARVAPLAAVVGKLDIDEQVAWGDAYLNAGVACPFLDAEACSIYADRPTICREYLVTTPAANCRTPTPTTIRRVPLAGSVSAAVAAVDRDLDHAGPLLLVDSLDWSAANPAPPPTRSGPEMVQAVFAVLAAGS